MAGRSIVSPGYNAAMKVLAMREDPREPGSLAMARDESLSRLQRQEGGPLWLLRGHGWSRPTLTLGRGQNPSEGLLDEAREAGVDLVRRPTGGGWLLHLPGDLSVTAALAGPLGTGALRGAAGALARGFAHALRSLGIDAEVVPSRAGGQGREEICFQRADREEVVSGGIKVAGVALARVSRGALVQSALPLAEAEGRELEEFARRWDPARFLAARALAGLGGARLFPAVARVIAAEQGLEVDAWQWPERSLREAEALAREKYEDESFLLTGRVSRSGSLEGAHEPVR